jgi:V/A-type H+-transporting ATPase subunit E
MDVQLKELIERIKSEGVENAEQQAEQIVNEAEERAKKIVSDAEKEADAIRKEAEEEARKREATGRETLKQAGRDILLSTQKRLQELFDRIITRETGETMKGEYLQQLIGKAVEQLESDVADLSILVDEKELGNIEKGLHSKLSEELASGMEIKPLPGVEAGFRVSYKDGSAYYNFTSEGIAEILAGYLNPRLAEILKEAAAEQKE